MKRLLQYWKKYKWQKKNNIKNFGDKRSDSVEGFGVSKS